MKTSTLIFAALAALLTAPAAAGGKLATGASYTITIPEDDHRVAVVEATMLPDDEEFYMFPGANEFPRRWATFVSDFEVHDVNGRAVPFSEQDDGSWQMSSMPNGPVKIRYQVNLDHDNHDWSGGFDGAAYARDWGVFYAARSLFVVNGEDRRNVNVEFHLPANWRVTTPWSSREESTMRFSVDDHDALSTSIIFAGLHKEVAIEHGSFKILLALGGEQILANEDDFIGMATGVFDYYTDLMGGIPRLLSPTGQSTSVVVINEAEVTDGEALGNHISILLEPSGDPMSQMIARMIFAHEIFHLWNGKSFTPSGLDGEWVKEGFSNYYTLKALHHIGYLDDQAYLNFLGGFFYQRYDADTAVGQRSITEGELKHDHWGLIYCGGLFAGIAQDLMIRAATGNQKSLDDLMRNLYETYGDQHYEVSDVEEALNRLNGASQADFFERYVYGTDRLPVAEFLAPAGIEVREEDGRIVFQLREGVDPVTHAVQRSMFGE